MANISAHRALGTQPEQVTATVVFTGAADVQADGFTINVNPGGIVDEVVRDDGEGLISINLKQKWAAVDNCLVSFDLDGYSYSWEGLSDGYGVAFNTYASGTLKDVDTVQVSATLFLRLQ